MSRTLFVHVGPRKTATTAIQRLLHTHDGSIVIYPKLASGAAAHHRLVSGFVSASRTRICQEDLDVLFADVAAQSRDSDKNVVISSEALEVGNRDIGAFVRAILPYVGQPRPEVQLIVVCREHFSRASSWYNHLIRTGNGRVEKHELPDEFLIANVAKICYTGLIQRLSQSGFKVAALSYHPSTNWTDRFFKHIGFPKEQLPKSEMKLVAMSPKVLIATLGVRRAITSRELRARCQRALLKMRNSRSQSKFIFGSEAAKHAETWFKRDRELLVRQFGMEFPARNIATEQNEFGIDLCELEEIEAVARQFGPDGRSVVEFARQYLREVGPQ